MAGKRSIAAALVLGLLLMVSCGPGRKMGSTRSVQLDTIQVNASNNPVDVYRAAAPLEWEIIHTRASLSFNWKEKTANGREWITLHPYCYNMDSLVLDAKSMKIDTVMLWDDPNAHKLSYSYKDDQLKIKFQKSYISADTLKLYIAYKAMPYAEPAGGSSAITEDRGLYFINTDLAIPNKPAQIWTQGETESNSHWLPTIDKPNTRFKFQLELEVPDTMQTLSNGYLSSTTMENKKAGMRMDIWVMDKPIQAYAAMFAIGKFSIVKDKWHSKEVNYYVEKEFEPYARQMFKNTPEMMDFFSNVTGVPYPWNKYDQVVVRDYVSGAMENTTATLFGEFINQNAREIADHDKEDIVSHELFHMWFGDYVTCESWSNLTVNESFANYGEYLWRFYKYGKNSADRLAYNDLLKYLNKGYKTDPPLVRFYYADREEMFDRVSYEKGGAILRYMHGLMGDDVFFKAMQIYLTKNALHAAEATHWRLAVEEATGKDWNWFFNQWYYRGGHPILDIKYNYDDAGQKLLVTVTQKQDSGLYILPFKTAVIYGADKRIEDWNIKSKKQIFTYPYRNNVKPVIIPDALSWLPADIGEDKPMAQWLTTYIVGSDYIHRRLSIDAAYQKISDSSAGRIIDRALEDLNPAIKAYALKPLVRITDDHLQRHWHSQVAYLAINDAHNEVRANAFEVLGEWKYSNAKNDMYNAISDSSYLVAGAALRALNDIDDELAYSMAKKMLNTDPKAELENTIWDIIAKKGDSADFAIYTERASYVYGGKKISLDKSLSTYLENVKSDAVFEQGLKIMVQLANNESIKGYRAYVGNTMFELAKAYKEKKETAVTKRRLLLAKQYIRQVINAETDAANKKQYDTSMKEVFPAS